MSPNAEREETLELIQKILIEGHHVGWRNGISMKRLAEKCGIQPNQLRADASNKNSRGLILELRIRGVPVLSYVKGYYLPDPNNEDEDYGKYERWARGRSLAGLRSHSKAVKAKKVVVQGSLFKH